MLLITFHVTLKHDVVFLSLLVSVSEAKLVIIHFAVGSELLPCGVVYVLHILFLPEWL